MKKVMFYCQHILGIGHLVRSREIVRGLVDDFQVCFINGGEVIKDFELPPEVELVNISAIKTDSEFKQLQPVDTTHTLEEVQEIREQQILEVFQKFQPDILIVESFPFSGRKFLFELMLLLIEARSRGTKIVCSLRDIVVTKQNQRHYEQKVCRFINDFFDMLLIHGDPKFISLESSFSRVADLRCAVHYTGYVAQEIPKISAANRLAIESRKPLILVSVGGGRFGHELLECVVKTAPILAELLHHNIQIFTGPFCPDNVFKQLQELAAGQDNITVDRYTPYLLNYMQEAELSISMSGYNTTMNILRTGVRAMLLPFTGNNDREQTIRANKLADLGIIELINPAELQPEQFAKKIVTCLTKVPHYQQFNFQGVSNTAEYLKSLIPKKKFIA